MMFVDHSYLTIVRSRSRKPIGKFVWISTKVTRKTSQQVLLFVFEQHLDTKRTPQLAALKNDPYYNT